MSYQLQVIKDFPIGFWSLDETSGTSAYDLSGCSNDGTYHGDLTTNILPLVPGGVSGSIINSESYIDFPLLNNYYGATTIGGLATKYNSDNDFSIELWAKINITSVDQTTLFADKDNEIGLFYENGSILFSAQNEKLYATPRDLKKAIHIVATFSSYLMTIWVDGILLESKPLNDFKFTNDSVSFSSGPTENIEDSFVLDAPAVYRYAINESQIKKHYSLVKTRTPNQIVYPDNGYLFSLNDDNIREIFYYRYPVNKSFRSLANENLSYDYTDESLKLIKGDAQEKTGVILDYIVVPITSDINYSKIEWHGTNGISVYVNTTGLEEDYQECQNGESVLNYNEDGMDPSGKLYIKILFFSPDSSKYSPYLNYFSVSFYKTKQMYADNSGDTIRPYSKNYHLGGSHYDLLSRSYFDGLRTDVGGGFTLSTDKDIKTLEFFMTPTSTNDTTLIGATDTYLSWDAGSLSKANIDKVYINGADKSSATSLTSLMPYLNDIYHIVIVFTDPVTGDIIFNGGTEDPEALFNNLAYYESELDQAKVSEHYELYTSVPSGNSEIGTMSVTESTVKAFDVNWQVIQSR